MRGSCQLAGRGDTRSENNENNEFKRRDVACLTPTLAESALAEKRGDKEQEEPEAAG